MEHLLGEASCPVIRIPKQPSGESPKDVVNSHMSAVLGVDPIAPGIPSNGGNPGQCLDCNLLRPSEPEPPREAIPDS